MAENISFLLALKANVDCVMLKKLDNLMKKEENQPNISMHSFSPHRQPSLKELFATLCPNNLNRKPQTEENKSFKVRRASEPKNYSKDVRSKIKVKNSRYSKDGSKKKGIVKKNAKVKAELRRTHFSPAYTVVKSDVEEIEQKQPSDEDIKANENERKDDEKNDSDNVVVNPYRRVKIKKKLELAVYSRDFETDHGRAPKCKELRQAFP